MQFVNRSWWMKNLIAQLSNRHSVHLHRCLVKHRVKIFNLNCSLQNNFRIQTFNGSLNEASWLLHVKGTVHPKIQNAHFSSYLYIPLTFYKVLCIQLNYFGVSLWDTGHSDVGLFSNIMGLHNLDLLVVFKAPKIILIINLSFQKSWPGCSR